MTSTWTSAIAQKAIKLIQADDEFLISVFTLFGNSNVITSLSVIVA